ncbi:MAG: M14 family zinc carboxypeptidase [Gemmatimonadaceae bacterium]|nr:M14 family zinc carboxypeptidase [Gemmatimonadaceae bacterium]
MPTPLEMLGYMPGTIGRLAYSAEAARYYRAVDAASDRVQVVSLGKSEEGREMVMAIVADEATIAKLDDYKAILRKLTDPRGLSAAERAELVKMGKPVYLLSGALHSTETGSPEAMIEMLYRLAVDEGENIRKIRENVITMIIPVWEVDGRDHYIDFYQQNRRLNLAASAGVGLPYWGKYVAHDNNRDGMALTLELTRSFLRTFLDWRPTVTHDLHESVPFLYTSTGTGPYNTEYDAIQIDEWFSLAYSEITELTRRGLPGVFTYQFYDGWAPNYGLSIANLHNSIGRFYETYTSSGADCVNSVALPATATSVQWYRPNPPVNGVKWCIRSNVNYQQSGVLVALRHVADNRQKYLENAVTKAERTIARGTRAAPYAFVVPRGQRRAAEAAEMVNLFRTQGTEVHEATQPFSLGTGKDTVTVAAGDWIVRLDQPYTQFPRTVLSLQSFKPSDPQPYDDTGWTMDLLRHVTTLRIADSTVLAKPMRLLTADAVVTGTVAGAGNTLIVPHLGDWRSSILPWKVAGARVRVADSAFTVGGTTYAAGTFLVTDAPAVRTSIAALGLAAVAAAEPAVPSHAITLPRIAIMHSWISTQDEGWVRYAFERLGVRTDYLPDQEAKVPGVLDRFDVVVFPHVGGNAGALLNGRSMAGPPVPWKKSAETPHLGSVDETDDVRPGMGLDGLLALRRFVERGGMLFTEGATSRFVADMGFHSQVSAVTTSALRARGGVFRGEVVTASHPMLYGYERRNFPLFFSQAPVLQVGGGAGFGGGGGGAAAAPSGPAMGIGGKPVDPAILAETERVRPKVVVRWASNPDSVLISGLIAGGGEMAGRAAVVDAPVGNGHVILMGTRPWYRWQNQGSMAMAFNAIANWNALSRPSAAATAARPGTRGTR